MYVDPHVCGIITNFLSVADTKSAVKQKDDVSKVTTRGSRQIQRCPISFPSESESPPTLRSGNSGVAVPPVKGINKIGICKYMSTCVVCIQCTFYVRVSTRSLGIKLM